MRTVGTKAMGIRTPIIKSKDNLAEIVVQSLLESSAAEGFSFHDRDVVGITEAVVARAQGNYASVQDIAACVRSIFPNGTVGILFPILSRNRFAVLLKGIAMGADKVVVQLSYPSDEVGNELITREQLYSADVDPYQLMDEATFRKTFGNKVQHRFTGVDYISYYKSLGTNIEVVLGSDPKSILTFTDQVIVADVHTRAMTKRIMQKQGAHAVCLDEILSSPVNGSGYHEEYGLLGSNKATEDTVKLFPRNCQSFVEDVQRQLLEATGKHIEVMVYGDGGFKDPVGGIWELADPVVSPGFTEGLRGRPNELKLKYLADNDYADLQGEELKEAIQSAIRAKDDSGSLYNKMESEGTTPRQLTDLLGSLCDLVSGSGDKGTPIVLVQGYFDNYATQE
ncbi:MAG: coenzyme F420-0:L-glutamate ligase [Christensenellales bacterium]